MFLAFFQYVSHRIYIVLNTKNVHIEPFTFQTLTRLKKIRYRDQNALTIMLR